MGKTLLFVMIALLATTLPQSSSRAEPMSDDEKKRAFIESRRSPSSASPTKQNVAPVAESRSTPARSSSGSTSGSSKNTNRRVAGENRSSREKKQRSAKPKVAPRKPSPSRSSAAPRSAPRSTPPPATSGSEVDTEPFLPPSATPEKQATPERRSRQRTQRSSRSPRSPHGGGGSAVGSVSAPVVISKTGLQTHEEFLPPPKSERRGWFFRRGPKYKYLTPGVRHAIDTARIRKGRWVNIVIHNSGTRQGSAKAFDYYHRKVRKMENGLAYHFVIGNGSSTGNGEIEIGSRWTRQINGGHVRSNRLNDISLGICFVGDFNRDRPNKEQLESLQELITYLRKRLGKTHGKLSRVETHKGINPVPTDCPGDRFPYKWFYQCFGKR